jgi:mRNA-degrading endonuclease RelE of RelBE toxin-antitoxin system
MKTYVNKNVLKDAEKVPNSIKALVLENIKALEDAVNLYDLNNVRQMEGTEEPYYRLKMRNYRLLLHYEQETKTVTVKALTHRKDTYKKGNLPWRK